MFKPYLVYVLLLGFLISCKSTPKSEVPSKTEVNDSIVLEKYAEPNLEPDISSFVYTGEWQSYKYERDSFEKTAFPESYAKEFSRYANFRLDSDSIFFNKESGQPIYSYLHSTRKKGFDVERPFLDKFSTNEDSLKFVAQYNGLYRVRPFTLLLAYNDDLVLRDRGYYFYFRKVKKRPTNLFVSGCPGDTRNEFSLIENLEIQNLNRAYQKFRIDFPYVSERLVEELPNKPFKGMLNGVDYLIQEDNIKIRLDDPQGLITIEFLIIKVGMKTKYKIEYLE